MGHETGLPLSGETTGHEALPKGRSLPLSHHPSVPRDKRDEAERELRQYLARSPKTYTTNQVAKIVNRSIDTVRRWRKEGSVVPSKEKPMGELMVHVYTSDDVMKAMDYAKTVKPGRPRGKRNTAPTVVQPVRRHVVG